MNLDTSRTLDLTLCRVKRGRRLLSDTPANPGKLFVKKEYKSQPITFLANFVSRTTRHEAINGSLFALRASQHACLGAVQVDSPCGLFSAESPELSGR